MSSLRNEEALYEMLSRTVSEFRPSNLDEAFQGEGEPHFLEHAIQRRNVLSTRRAARHCELGVVLVQCLRHVLLRQWVSQLHGDEPIFWQGVNSVNTEMSMLLTVKAAVPEVLQLQLGDRGWKPRNAEDAGQYWEKDSARVFVFFERDLQPLYRHQPLPHGFHQDSDTMRRYLDTERHRLDLFDTLRRDLWGSAS